MSDRKLSLYVVGIALFWLVVVVYAVHPNLPANPIQLPFEENSVVVRLLPQGWAFFTRDPRSPEMFPFLRDADGSWTAVPRIKRSWPHPLNFSRKWKLPGVETGIILYEPQEQKWQSCSVAPLDCFGDAPMSGTVTNQRSDPLLCGEVGVVRQEPLPWAWSEAPDETIMPSEVLRAQVTCRD